ncbi:uncharacterized protein [Halyomorpha halys]|uniref:uncharacterized protein n=1 Tax=Halyomorpha halys TaxID=286706 RepID=UPI0006D526AE|nr:uncharacterized protein LOC106688695 [Halyomorpha halys]XP_014288877.1 uncharacterized protein LOC106688695 [Halyomorpha halys]XP_014288951.1 uncharacterized protein LOC106688695 [Halyomorpha halys]XP_014289033.1 uncharacterized protein LOC106688695 [Halyomorpha halys]
MILKNGGSCRPDCDPINCIKQKLIVKHQSLNTRGEADTENRQKLCYQKTIASNTSCKAQQRLMNLSTKSKIKDVESRPFTDSLVWKASTDPKPPFIYEVQNYENIHASKTNRKLDNAIVINNGHYEYYPKDTRSNSDFTFKKTIKNDNEKLNENRIKVKLNNNAVQTINSSLYLSTMHKITDKKPEKYKSNKNFENVCVGTHEKTKDFHFSESDSSCVLNNNATSKKAGLIDITLKCSQPQFFKNEPTVSRVHTGNEKIIAKTRPLKISEALELHERENKLNFSSETDSSSKNNIFKDKFITSTKSNFENLKISEFHEDFLVEKLKNPIKSDRSICIEYETDCNNRTPREDFKTDDNIFEFLSCDDVSSEFTDHPKHSFGSRNSSSSYQRFSISTKSFNKDEVQKRSFKNNTSKIDYCINKRDGLTKSTSKNSRNYALGRNKSKSLLSLNSSSDCNSNSFAGLYNKYDSIEKRVDSKTTSTTCDENLLSTTHDTLFVKPEKKFISEGAYVMNNLKGFKQESKMIKKDRQCTRSRENIPRTHLISKFHTIEKKFSNFSMKDHPKMKKTPNPQTVPSKADGNNLNRNSSHRFQSSTSSVVHQMGQKKVLNDNVDGSNANTIRREPSQFSCQPSSKGAFKEYNNSPQQRLKYAKSCSDFNALLKSSFKYPGGNEPTQNNCCLAQQRLLYCKSAYNKTLKS